MKPYATALNQRLLRGQAPSYERLQARFAEDGSDAGEPIAVHCGWGRLLIGHTFPDAASLAGELAHEEPGERDIALYVAAPQQVLGLEPAQLFLDPSDTLRLWFSDYRLVELSARIPARFKLPDGGKQVLKQAARRVIPHEVIDRKKGYYPVPGLKHLEGATLGWVRDLLTDPSQDRGLFNPAMVDRLLSNPHGQLTPLRGSKLWQLAALNLWLSEQGI